MIQRLGDICAIEKGKTAIMKAIPGPFPMVTLSDERRSHNSFQFDAKAVIVPLISSTGHGHASMKRVHYQEGRFALGSVLCALIPRSEGMVLAKYVHLYLSYFKDDLLVPLMKGSANVSLSISKLAGVSIHVPSIAVQHRIIAFEASMRAITERLEESMDQQTSLLTRLRQSILSEAVQGRLVQQDPDDEPAEMLLRRIQDEKAKLIAEGKIKKQKPLPPIKDEEIPHKLPKGWVWCRLGEFTRFIDYRGKTPRKTPSGIKLVTAKNVKFGQYAQEPEEFMSESDYIKWMSRGYPEKGDILFTTEAPIGNLCQFTITERVALAQRIITIHPLGDFVKKYLLFSLMSGDVRKAIFARASGMTAKGIKSSKLVEVPIPIPPPREQHRIVAKVEHLLTLTKELENQVAQSKQYAEDLMQAALREAFSQSN